MGKIPWWVWGLGLGLIGYVLYKTVSKVPAAVNAATGAVAQGIADAWLSLPFPQPMRSKNKLTVRMVPILHNKERYARNETSVEWRPPDEK